MDYLCLLFVCLLSAMCNFVCPSQLGDLDSFRTNFAKPISVCNDESNATSEQKRLGRARRDQLKSITQTFILRRTADVLTKYLPPKLEIVVFCKLTPIQINIYRVSVCVCVCHSSHA